MTSTLQEVSIQPEERLVPPLREVRAACARCGAHARALMGLATLGGTCPNCGGVDLTVIEGGGPHASVRRPRR